MYVKRNIRLSLIIKYAWPVVIFATTWSTFIFVLYYNPYFQFTGIPFQPISVVGIAVAFFIGFKNNQSYDRFWEGRKIWGGIVNYSRTWTNSVLTLIKENKNLEASKVKALQTDLIYRHIGWLHALRIQLRQKTSFSPVDNKVLEKYFQGHHPNEKICEILERYLSKEEVDILNTRKNIATHLIKNQGQKVKSLSGDHVIDGFDKQILLGVLEELYNLQGKCERIKNTPFPRQYAYFSKIFNYIFVLLLPMGLLNIFHESMIKINHNIMDRHIFYLIPISVLVTWMFMTWEMIGDNSEDPFEGRTNDVPMTALTRTIEIDLKDMLDEKELPEKLLPIDDILY